MRGDFVTLTVPADFDQPRPALVLQSDRFDGVPTVTVLLVSETVVNAPLLRTTIEPSAENGLRKPSQVMVDKAMTVKRDRLGPAFGRIEIDRMTEVERSLAVFLGIAK